MIPSRATKIRFTLWTAVALLAVTVALALPQSVLAAPDRPTGLTATALDHDTVSLTWSHPDEENVDHYRVLRRSSDESRLSQIATTQTTTFQDDGLQPETTYIYRVQAVDSEGARGRRSVRSQTTTAAAPTITPPSPTPEPTPEHAQGQQGQNTTPRSSHGICDRTQEVQDAILNETGGTCSTVTESQLAGIQYLYTDGYSSATVVPGDFANLTGLIELGIWDSSELTTVPENAYSEVIGNGELINVSLVRNAITDVHIDAFDGLSGIKTLDLRYNLIETLEPGVFEGVSALTILDLSNNHIQNLEDGFFDDLTRLTHLDLTNNGLKRLDNAVIGGLSQLEILYLGDNELSNLEANTFNGLSSLQQLIVSGNGLSNLPAGIFDGLAELKQLYLGANSITVLDPLLFAPLDDSLETLILSHNRLEALPAGIFDGLPGLQRLSLNGNDISSLDAGVFGALTGALTILALNDNSLSTLPATVFDGLENLQTLLLNDNGLSTLDADIFDPLDDSLLYLYLNDNSISTLDADIFDGLTGLQYLLLNDNSLSTLDADLFDPLDDSLLLLYLNDNSLSTLDADIFDGLTGLLRVYLNDNSLSTLDADIFDGLAGLQRLYLNHNSLSSLPALIFEDLDDSLQQLVLTDNSISTLPAMVFAGLTGLQGLDLSCNGLTALDLTLFDPFASSLTYLDVSGNSYGSTPTETTLRDKFDQITATSGSLYTGSNSECLPPYEFGLSGLSLSPGTLQPAFQAPGETVYSARVGRDVSSIDVTVTTSDPRATIEPRPDPFGTYVTPGPQVNLTHVRSNIGWQVRVRNGSFAVLYQIAVYRDPPLATNALLRSLELSGVTLGEDFSGRTYTYTATADVAETTVTATPLDPDATTVIRNNGVVDSDGTVSLAAGANIITVEVTAEDGNTMRTYTVDVTRAAAPVDSKRVVYVPNNWSLKPAGIGPGERFRLIFLSSTKRDATSTDIETYNTFVQDLAANGHANIEDHSSRFRVVGCTESTDARDNTRTTSPGVPIYWLGGTKVADNYADFYDGSWDDEANDKNEFGNDAHNTSQVVNFPFTGCNSNGTELVSSALGVFSHVRLGRPDSTNTNHSPISSDAGDLPGNTHPFYALSPVFQVPLMNAYTLSKGGVPHPGKIDSDNNTGNYHEVRLFANVPYRIDVKGSERSQPGGTIRNPRVRIDAGSGKLELLNGSSSGVSQTSSVTTALRGGATSSSGTNSRLEIKVKPEQTGTYRLLVYRTTGDDGTYTITVNERDRPQGRLAPDITVTQENNTSVSFSWIKPNMTQRSITAPIQSYQVQYRPFPNGRWSTVQTLRENVLDHQFTGLSSGQSYDVRVRSYHPDAPYMTYQWGYARVYTTN